MEQLELKHIAPYLPYKPLCLEKEGYINPIEGIREVENDVSIANRKHCKLHRKQMSIEILMKLWHKEDLFWVDIYLCKLILRPM